MFALSLWPCWLLAQSTAKQPHRTDSMAPILVYSPASSIIRLYIKTHTKKKVVWKHLTSCSGAGHTGVVHTENNWEVALMHVIICLEFHRLHHLNLVIFTRSTQRHIYLTDIITSKGCCNVEDCIFNDLLKEQQCQWVSHISQITMQLQLFSGQRSKTSVTVGSSNVCTCFSVFQYEPLLNDVCSEWSENNPQEQDVQSWNIICKVIFKMRKTLVASTLIAFNNSNKL